MNFFPNSIDLCSLVVLAGIYMGPPRLDGQAICQTAPVTSSPAASTT